MKRFLSFFVTLILVSSVASALAESYNIVDIYEDRVPIFDIVLNAGDRITGKSGVTITLTFSDADGNSIGTSTGAIKTFTINGKQCSSWRVVGSSSSAITINNNMRGSFAYKLKPSYTAADGSFDLVVITDTPILCPHSSICSIAPALKVSPATNKTFFPSFFNL